LSRAAIFAVAAFSAATAFAVSLSPQYIELSSAGDRSRGHFVVRNNLRRAVAIEPQIEAVKFNSSSALEKVPTLANNFIVFPPAARIEPGDLQTFRVFWAGPPDLAESRLHKFSVSVARLSSGKRESADLDLNVKFKIGAFIAVRPLNGVPALRTERVWIEHRENTKSLLMAQIKNSGTSHFSASFGRLNIILRDASGAVLVDRAFSGSELRPKMGIGYIPPNGERTLSIPLEALIAPERRALVASADLGITLR